MYEKGLNTSFSCRHAAFRLRQIHAAHARLQAAQASKEGAEAQLAQCRATIASLREQLGASMTALHVALGSRLARHARGQLERQLERHLTAEPEMEQALAEVAAQCDHAASKYEEVHAAAWAAYDNVLIALADQGATTMERIPAAAAMFAANDGADETGAGAAAWGDDGGDEGDDGAAYGDDESDDEGDDVAHEYDQWAAEGAVKEKEKELA